MWVTDGIKLEGRIFLKQEFVEYFSYANCCIRVIALVPCEISII